MYTKDSLNLSVQLSFYTQRVLGCMAIDIYRKETGMFQNVTKYTYRTGLMACSCLCAASFAAQASEMQCLNVNCESLGYTNISDLGNTPCDNFLTCPYDPRYVKCDLLPTCENLGYTKDDKSSWCTNIVRCPTDPSYTLCKSLCGECPDGTALDPAELGCGDAYEAAYRIRRPKGGRARKEFITNDCGYTCFRCTECVDTAYYCENPVDIPYESCIEDGGSEDSCECSTGFTETACPEGTYIAEVRHPTCAHNASEPDRYVCKSCPEGLINSGTNNYDCNIHDENGTRVGCDNSKGYYNSCQAGWDKCSEIHFEFGTCYVDSLVCGEGKLSDYKYPKSVSLPGHTWDKMTDSAGNICWKTECSDSFYSGKGKLSGYKYPKSVFLPGDHSFRTLAGCIRNYDSYGVKCKEDGFSCYVFDKCDDGYEENRTQGTVSCVCNTELYPYDEDDYVSHGSFEDTCEDNHGEHYGNLVCDDGYEQAGDECVCSSVDYPYTTANKPRYSYLKEPLCEDDNGYHYRGFTCWSNYEWDEEEGRCVCDRDVFPYTKSMAFAGSHVIVDGSTCTDATGDYYSEISCERDYSLVGTQCLCETRFKYTNNNVIDDAHPTGSACTDTRGEFWDDFECDSGYIYDNGRSACMAASCDTYGLYNEQDIRSPRLINCDYETSVAGETCYTCDIAETCEDAGLYSASYASSPKWSCAYITSINAQDCYNCSPNSSPEYDYDMECDWDCDWD